MAIKINASTEEVQGGGIQLFSGISNFQVIAVNPSLDELHALEIMVKTEPNYSVNFGGDDFNKVVFWVKNQDLTTKVEFLTAPVERVASTGKHQWINNVGQTTWSDGAPTFDWWKSEGSRHALKGEEELVFFMKAWANVANGDDVYLETIKKITAGDVTELKEYITALEGNRVRLLVGVKDDKYQATYTKYFGRIKPQRDDMFVKMLQGDYSQFKADFNADLKWGNHIPTVSLLAPDALNEDDDWATSDAPSTVAADEDLPF
jgi:hypothetical protein